MPIYLINSHDITVMNSLILLERSDVLINQGGDIFTFIS